jgi:N-acyl-D-amino-acid deacylase
LGGVHAQTKAKIPLEIKWIPYPIASGGEAGSNANPVRFAEMFSESQMNAGRKSRARQISAWRMLWVLWLAGAGGGRAQPYDFGYVAPGAACTLDGLAWGGGSWNGTQAVMAAEAFIGPDAADFSTSTNYTGQTLFYGESFPYSLTFAPGRVGFESATLTNFVTPSPPFGAGTMNLQGTGLPATLPASGPIVPELAPLQEAMTNYLFTHHFAAGTIALMHDSKLVLREGYGWRDTNFTTVIHPDNLFRLASVSKMLTASAIYKLVDAGKISTDTKIDSYLGIPPWGGALGDERITNITVQNLLDHSGGWDRDTSPVGDPVFDTIQISTEMGLNYPAAPTNVISWMFSKPLDFAPGTKHVYSNFGYQILGRIIEKAGGKPYADYIQQDLLGGAGLINPLGFTNVIQARSRPGDLAPWEIWYAGAPQYLEASAVDFPTNRQVRDVDGGIYYESLDGFGGMCASAIGLCHYLLHYWEGGDARLPGEDYGWNYDFYGSLPGTTTVLSQNISESASATNGLEFALLFNERDNDPNDNQEADNAIVNAAGSVTSWPTNGGGSIEWGMAATNVDKNAGSVTVPLVRSDGGSLPVKVSYTTYALTAGSSKFVARSGVVVFAAGATRENVTVPILNDRRIDPATQFSLELISAAGGAWLGDCLSCVVTILDTNVPPQFVGLPAALPGGGFQAQISCGPGLLLTLERSTNLLDWESLQTFTNISQVTTITDTNIFRRSASFYRVAVP